MNAPNPRWKQRPPGSNWGDYGPDDQLGRKNLLTDERVLRAAQEIRIGKRFCLSLPLDVGPPTNPRRWLPKLRPIERDGEPYMNYPWSRAEKHLTDVVSDDCMEFCLQYSTHWDALSHYGGEFDADGDGKPELVYYNGYRAGVDVIGPIDYMTDKPTGARVTGAKKLGAETISESGFQGRGVMVDFKAHLPLKRHAVTYDELMHILEKDKVVVEEGDILCLRSGIDRILMAVGAKGDPRKVFDVNVALNGRDQKLLNWITDSGVVALVSDTTGVELFPNEGVGTYAGLPLHEHCLFKLGVQLGEMFLLSDLADWLRANGRYRFFLTANGMRMPGACGTPVAAIATV